MVPLIKYRGVIFGRIDRAELSKLNVRMKGLPGNIMSCRAATCCGACLLLACVGSPTETKTVEVMLTKSKKMPASASSDLALNIDELVRGDILIYTHARRDYCL